MTQFIFTAVDHTYFLLWACILLHPAVAQLASHQHLATGSWDQSQVFHVGFVVDKVTVGEVYSKYFSFSCQLSFQQCSILFVCHPVPVL